jgi:excisionase family DNA binding protein
MSVLTPIQPTEDDQEFAAQAMRQFSTLSFTLREKLADQVKAERTKPGLEPPPMALVPAHIAELFRQILAVIAQGKPVTIVPLDRMLTSQDAADLLNVSRPFLVKLLEKENIPVQRVGNRRRIAFKDVMALKDKLQKRS